MDNSIPLNEIKRVIRISKMNGDRRKEDDNNGWDEYRIYVTQELKRQGEVQTIIVTSVQEIEKRLIEQETKMRNVSGIVSFTVSVIISSIGSLIMYFTKRG